MIDSYVQHRLYLQQIEMLKKGRSSEIVPVNFNYQDTIIVATGLVDYNGISYVFQSNSCGCGPQPTIRGAFLAEIVPWQDSDLYAWFAAGNTKDRKIADQKVVAEVYRVRLPVDDREKEEITAALRSQFGADKEFSFF